MDYKLYRVDIKGSKAHAKMLNKCGIISDEEFTKIDSGLDSILLDIENGNLEFSKDAEDIHMFIESELTNRIGDAGKKLHTARSRNDQVAVDVKLFTIEASKRAIDLLVELERIIFKVAEENLDSVMPGYTHLQIAQPVTFAHHIMAYAQMF